MERILVVGLEAAEVEGLARRVDARISAFVDLPRILVEPPELRVERQQGPGWLHVDRVLFHSIYDDDLDFIGGLALWGGPCLPNARAMLDCRLKLPCLIRALSHSRYGAPRGYISPGATVVSETERVAKWGNWHCGENKTRFTGLWRSDAASYLEPFFPGEAVRVVVIGDRHWQIRLTGEGWLKSIHPDDAALMAVDPELLADTEAVRRGLGLELIANDYMVGDDGARYLLEANHIPNVSRFPEIQEAYLDFAAAWATAG